MSINQKVHCVKLSQHSEVRSQFQMRLKSFRMAKKSGRVTFLLLVTVAVTNIISQKATPNKIQWTPTIIVKIYGNECERIKFTSSSKLEIDDRKKKTGE